MRYYIGLSGKVRCAKDGESVGLRLSPFFKTREEALAYEPNN